MKILVAIANYGNRSRQYLNPVLDEYRSMAHQVDIVVLSNIPKEFGPGVEVIVGLPSKNPWSLPFGHKALFAQRIEDYDLFIYSEDDILVSNRNIDAFCEVTQDLNDDEVAGFMRVENYPDGHVSYDMMHSFYRWDPRTVRQRKGDLYAWCSNEHAAAYILTRDQLRRAIDSGGFLVEPYEHRYDLLCTAATDPYTSCGMVKLINLSRIEDFQIRHLPNKYLGIYGITEEQMRVQIDALERVASGEIAAEVLLEVETRLPASRGSKMIYAPVDKAIMDAIPETARRLLIVGAGHGATEKALLDRGHTVAAVPVDSVIGHVLGALGVEVLHADVTRAVEQLAGREFDAVIFPDTLHLFPSPAEVLRVFSTRLVKDGLLLVTTPNTGDAKILWRRIKRDAGYRTLGSFEQSGSHHATRGSALGWLRAAGLTGARAVGVMTAKRERINHATAGLGVGLLADRWVFSARAR